MLNLSAQIRVSLKIGLFALITMVSAVTRAETQVPPYLSSGMLSAEYLPQDTEFLASVPSPEDFLGFPVGKWHIRHDQLVAYMYKLAETSDRVTITETGRTHQDKPLLLLTIAHPDKKGQVDAMRQTHLQDIAQQRTPNTDAPLFLYMGYSIHGNEPSGSNAALLISYYLAAGNDERINALLDNTVILLDPSLNPDGLSRFAHWANMHKGYQLNKSRFHREHNENWPSGRTNYYWFDLNRDWLLLTHPESQARIAQFQSWRPHVLTDFHEMGTNSTYFFQPGVRARKNPLTPDGNVTLTEALAKFHAQALDNTDQLYFTEEGFDDFYYGKGSSYPDAHGSVGILFEQARSRGHIQESINGDLGFNRTIQNQITTTLSTFDGALANKAALLDFQVTFAQQTQALIKDDDVAGMLLRQPRDVFRFRQMLSKLEAHNIEYSIVTSDSKIDGQAFTANQSVYVPFDQPQYRLIKSIFSERQSFPDNTFYDVSNWNMPMAFDVEYAALSARQARQLKLTDDINKLRTAQFPQEGVAGVAYAFDWHHYQAPALAHRLLQEGFELRVAGKPFTADIGGEQREFLPGTVLVMRALNKLRFIQSDVLARQFNIPLWSIRSGLTQQGIDLGSRNMKPLNLPKVLLVGGEGTTETEVGEIWHYLDTRVGMPTTLIDQNELNRVQLTEFTHIVFARGRYQTINERAKKSLDAWLKSGGTLIGQKSALRWFKANEWLDISIVSSADIDKAFDESTLNYGDRDDLAAKKRVAGAAFDTNIDLTHPLFFGFDDSDLPMFKTDNMVVKATGSPFDTLAKYTSSPLAGGYASDELSKKIADSAAIVVQRKGQGRVIGFVDNVNFRGYWYGTSKLMGNAIFMSELMN